MVSNGSFERAKVKKIFNIRKFLLKKVTLTLKSPRMTLNYTQNKLKKYNFANEMTTKTIQY